MTVGYGGLSELRLSVRWAKVFRASRSHSGKFHAWGPMGTLCGRLPGERATRFMRDRVPVRACQDCVVAIEAEQESA